MFYSSSFLFCNVQCNTGFLNLSMISLICNLLAFLGVLKCLDKIPAFEKRKQSIRISSVLDGIQWSVISSTL